MKIFANLIQFQQVKWVLIGLSLFIEILYGNIMLLILLHRVRISEISYDYILRNIIFISGISYLFLALNIIQSTKFRLFLIKLILVLKNRIMKLIKFSM